MSIVDDNKLHVIIDACKTCTVKKAHIVSLPLFVGTKHTLIISCFVCEKYFLTPVFTLY